MEPKQIRNLILLALVVLLLAGSRAIANFVIDYQWWREVGQIETWISMLIYEILPAALAAAGAWLLLLWAHARGLQFAGVPSRAYALYSRLVVVGLLLISILFIASSIDSWTVMAFVGSMGAEPNGSAWTDPVFGWGLSFYLFDLPFYNLLLRYLLTVTLFAAVIFWATARGWQIFERLQRFRESGGRVEEFDPGPNPLLLAGATRTSFARVLGSILLVAAAAWFFLGRYGMLLNRHSFMTGMDYVDEQISLPLRWVVILALAAGVPLIWSRNIKLAGGLIVGALAANAVIPGLVSWGYVRPNELRLERSYIQRHIEATTEAYALNRGEERTFAVSASDTLDIDAHTTLVDNIRLWDTTAFTDTITQIQALRPYYRFADIDIDRYQMDGKIRQVLLSPREIDVNALPPEARASWINTHFFYTHGYGIVMSEVNRTTPDGLPRLIIQDAPPEIRTDQLRLERPEIYYGEVTHDPVFVNTDQEEFDYPSGDQNITSSYEGSGGFPINSLPLRLAAALRETDVNILLTSLTNPGSRMMIYRNVSERLNHLADFITWDYDPYLVLTEEGRLVWIVDGYTTSDAHPYSAPVALAGAGRRGINYIRNSVKATVDAYHGTTTIYVEDPDDPILRAYRSLFPNLFHDVAEMPPGIRSHVRYPLLMFDVQAEMYRTFHMRDPGVFYNKEDVWEIGRNLSGDTGRADRMRPTYIVATLPGESEPEFILMLPFTPRGKDNLVGWMAARCDGDKLGELVYFQLSKQQLVFGPNQIESRINQDQEIARDLTLWNQQGSRVLRGDMLALPIGDNFLYVESIYIQAESARMPQLKKVVLAMGDRLIYENTFEDALRRLGAGSLSRPEPQDERLSEAAEPTAPGAEAEAEEAPAEEQRRVQTLANRMNDIRRQAEDLLAEIERLQRELRP